jgi:desulfoferrodoxin-like iron-binding protein
LKNRFLDGRRQEPPSGKVLALFKGLLFPQTNLYRGDFMGVKKVGEKYKCNVCGNEVMVTKVGGGELVCCGEPMELLKK